MSTKDLSTKNQQHKEFFKDIGEMGLDKYIETIFKDSDLLQSLPIIKWLFIGNDFRTTIQTAHFIKKYACFIGKISSAECNNDELLPTILDKSIQQNITDQTMIYLDRYHTDFKAILLGELFVQTFIKGNFSSKEYNSLMFSIEQIHPFEGIENLKQFYDYLIKMELESDPEEKRIIWKYQAKLEYQNLATTGLLTLPSGANTIGNLGGANLNEIGRRFYETVVKNCDQKSA